jgi:hypothetical protein
MLLNVHEIFKRVIFFVEKRLEFCAVRMVYFFDKIRAVDAVAI